MKKAFNEKPIVFISWSGKYSKSYEVAVLLHEWLPVVIQQVDFWISEDVELGKFAIQNIFSKLFIAKAGIFCITEKSLNSNWLNFEAGAISKANSATDANDVNNVISLLIDVPENNFYNSGSPLTNFQSVSLTKKNMLKIVNTLNNLTDNPLSEEILRKAFEANWEAFEKEYKTITSSKDIDRAKAIEYKHKDIDLVIKPIYDHGLRLYAEKAVELKKGCLFCIDVINRLSYPMTIYEIGIRFNDNSTYYVEHRAGYILGDNKNDRDYYSDILPITIEPNSFSPLFYLLAADEEFINTHNGEKATVICKTDIYDLEKEIDFVPIKNGFELFDNYFVNKHDNV